MEKPPTSALRAYRLRKRLTHESLGVQLGGIAPSTVHRWENERIPADRVILVEAATGIPRQELRPDLYVTRKPRGSLRSPPPDGKRA